MTDFRALCVELVEAWDSYSYADAGDAADRMAEAVKAARTALAQPVPPAEGEVGDEARRLAKELRDQADDMSPALELFGLMHRAADLLEQRHAEPVPVSERLPGPEDCLDEGWAWFFNPRTGWRRATQPVHSGYTHWLPATALPLPLPLPQQETPND